MNAKEKRIEEIIKDYSCGMSITEIMRKYEASYSFIKKQLIKNDVPNNFTGRFSQKYIINEDYAEILVRKNGGFVSALIDLEDVDRCREVGIWSATKCGYILNSKTGMYLHRFVMNCPVGVEVDHINHNLLDNRKSQLRFATSSQQKMNTHIRIDNSSGCRGVYFDRERNTWNVSINKNGKKAVFKRFYSLDDAISYCKLKRAELFGEFDYKGDINSA